MDSDDREPAFVLHPGRADGAARWVVWSPRDPYGDGVGTTFVSELHDDGLAAVIEAEIDGAAVRLPAFIETLAEGWRGWDGARSWYSLDRRLFLDARHDGRGHVDLEVALQQLHRPSGDTRWIARAVFRIEAGEELTRLAADLSDALRA